MNKKIVSKIATVVLLPTLILLSQSCSSDHKLDRSVKTPVPTFVADSALKYLYLQTNQGPRVPNTLAHQQTAALLLSELKRFTPNAAFQSFTTTGYADSLLYLKNIMASFYPSEPIRIMLSAHWDTRPFADRDSNNTSPNLGANDGASGVAVLLEIARLLSEFPPGIGVDIFFWDGEDYGKADDLEKYLLGSTYWAKNKNKNYQPIMGILLDMVGDSSSTFKLEGYSTQYAEKFQDEIWTTALKLGFNQFEKIKTSPIWDDHVPIISYAGIPTVNIIGLDLTKKPPTPITWHTQADIPENINKNTLQAVGTTLLHLIYKDL